MMMKMLEAGGLPVLTDHVRGPDDDNPKGYYEFERVKQIEHDREWLPKAQGQAVKMIAALLKHLPPDYIYKVIFMQREMDEVLASQRQMLIRRGEPVDDVPDDRLAGLYGRHVQQVQSWLADRPYVDVLYVDYADVLSNPLDQARRINRFLAGDLDTAKMASVVDPDLYRQRG